MKARIVTFAGGVRWLAEGWRLFRVSPLAWVALVFVYWMAMTAVSLVPFVGVAAAMVLVPGFSVGFMAASRSCDRAQVPELRQLFEGFRLVPLPQLALGVIYLAAIALLFAAAALADGGALARWMLHGQPPGDATLDADALLGAMMIAAALYVPVMMAFWFAPLLAAWHALGVGQALFYSFFACLMNWRAFLGYGAATLVVTVAVPFLVLGALALVSGGELRSGATKLVLPMLMLLLPVLLASFYASYRDVFGAKDAE